MKKLVVFDLDGTLTNPGLGITNSVIYALNKFGIKENDRESLYRFIGPPLADSFKEFYGFDEQKAWTAVEYYREYFADKGLFENFVYDGIKDLLTELKNRGYQKTSLAVQKANYAVKMYKNVGFEIIDENEEEYIMMYVFR